MAEGSSSILNIYVPSNGFSTHRANTLSPARKHGKPASFSPPLTQQLTEPEDADRTQPPALTGLRQQQNSL